MPGIVEGGDLRETGTVEGGGRKTGTAESGGRMTGTAESGGRKTGTAERGGRKTGTAERGGRKTGTAERAWEAVLRTIEADLLSGSLKPGDHLPPERTLAADLAVGRSSVREALRVLEALGLIRTQTGSGPGAGAIIVATPSGGMGTLMRLQVAATGFAVADIVKTRLLLETAVARELAANAPSTDLAASVALLDAMDDPGLTPAEFLALDAAFHVSLAEASGNQVVAAIMSGLRISIQGYVQAGVPSLPSWDAAAGQLRGEHRGIVAAVAGGDPSLAASRISAHITGYYTATSLPLHERN